MKFGKWLDNEPLNEKIDDLSKVDRKKIKAYFKKHKGGYKIGDLSTTFNPQELYYLVSLGLIDDQDYNNIFYNKGSSK